MKKDALIAAGFVAAFYALISLAGADNTFADQSDFIRSNLEGKFGLSLSLLCLAAGLGIGIVKQSVMAVVAAVGIAILASIGPRIMYGIFSAVM